MEPILKVSDINVYYGAIHALKGLSFHVEEGEIVSLIGANGAGKTTTIRMILGVMNKDEGDILWNGQPLDRNRVRVGYMPEERGIYPKNKVLEQLVYFGELRGMSRGTPRSRT